ncbi:MAG TPA: hypothetical protein VGC92_14635 [Phenylobacterium sp.]|jgi:hypothetical protein
MIAMLLMAQLGVVQAPPPANFVSPPNRGEIISQLKLTTPCGAPSRVEASFGAPATLYRKGDRPAKLLSRWQDFPDAHGCLVEARP